MHCGTCDEMEALVDMFGYDPDKILLYIWMRHMYVRHREGLDKAPEVCYDE